MRIIPLLLGLTGSLGLAVACAHAQPDRPVEALEQMPLCQLSLVQAPYGRELVAEAAPGLSGFWTLEAGGPSMMMQQSGDLRDRPERATDLARLQLATASGPAPGLDGLRPGQTIVGGSGQGLVFATLRLENASGELICFAELGQEAHSD